MDTMNPSFINNIKEQFISNNGVDNGKSFNDDFNYNQKPGKPDVVLNSDKPPILTPL